MLRPYFFVSYRLLPSVLVSSRSSTPSFFHPEIPCFPCLSQ